MRSSHWQYLGFILIGVGSGLAIAGLIAFTYFQQYYWISSPYRAISLPLLIIGICFIGLGIIALWQANKKKHLELINIGLSPSLPPPPLSIPPPPPPY
jgi:ABC-type antimicrobial peptide transport system permease subunit